MKAKHPSPGEPIEARSFKLVREMQRTLADVLNSLGGKSGKGLFEHFLFYTSAQIHRTAEGFVALRRSRRVAASKLLVRPAIELMLRQQAVLRQPALLYRLAYTERMEDRKWVRPAYVRRGKDYDTLDERQWQKFSRKYEAQYPTHAREAKPLTLYDAAKAANLESYYDSHYRLYCQFTHGAFRAAVGAMAFTDAEDNRTVAACVFSALEALGQGVKADVPRLDALRQRLFGLHDRQPRKRPDSR